MDPTHEYMHMNTSVTRQTQGHIIHCVSCGVQDKKLAVYTYRQILKDHPPVYPFREAPKVTRTLTPAFRLVQRNAKDTNPRLSVGSRLGGSGPRFPPHTAPWQQQSEKRESKCAISKAPIVIAVG